MVLAVVGQGPSTPKTSGEALGLGEADGVAEGATIGVAVAVTIGVGEAGVDCWGIDVPVPPVVVPVVVPVVGG